MTYSALPEDYAARALSLCIMQPTVSGGDAGIFRDFQFPNSQTVTLKTTLEEIGILWKQEARFRQGFETSGNLVTVPNIFAKISGVKDGSAAAYWEEIRERLTPETILRVKTADQQPTANPDLSVYRSFYRNGKIDAERLKASSLNRYSYLPDRIQDMLLFKLQEAAEFLYNMEVPKFKIPSEQKNGGFFGRLFRK